MKNFSTKAMRRIVCLTLVLSLMMTSEMFAQFGIPYVPSIPIRPRPAPRPTPRPTTPATPQTTPAPTPGTAPSPVTNPYVLISQALSQKYEQNFIRTMSQNLLQSSSANRLEMVRLIEVARKSAAAGKKEDTVNQFLEFIKVMAPGQPDEAYQEIGAAFEKLTTQQMVAHLSQYAIQIEAISRAIVSGRMTGSVPGDFKPQIIMDTIPEERSLPTEAFDSNGIPFYVPPLLELNRTQAAQPQKVKPTDADKYWVIIYDASHPKGGSKAPVIKSYRDDISTLYSQLVEAGMLESQILLLDEKTGASKDRFLSKLQETVSKLEADSHLLIYFQGYAIHLEGTDYLVPDDFLATDIERAIQNRGKKVPLPSLLALQDILDILATSKCFAHGLIINPHSAHPADIANVSVAASYPVIPFGSQKELSIPDQTVVIVSRSLQNLPRNAGILGIHLARTLPKTTVFIRVVLESLSGFALNGEDGEDSGERVTTRHFIDYIQRRSQLENYREPLIRSNITTEFTLAPYFETPKIVSQIDQTLVAQIQDDMYVAGCRVLMEGHDTASAASLLGDCMLIDPTSITARKAYLVLNLALVSSGDVRRAFRESRRPDGRVFAYVWSQSGALIFSDKVSDETATTERKVTKTETKYVRGAFGRRIPKQVPVTTIETVEATLDPGTGIYLDDFHEYAPGQFRCHVVKVVESSEDEEEVNVVRQIVPMVTDTESEPVGWVDAKALNADAFGLKAREKLQVELDIFTRKIYDRYGKRLTQP